MQLRGRGWRTLKKYRSVCILLFGFNCPENTSPKQMSAPMVITMGVKIHAKRPIFPILLESVVGCGGVVVRSDYGCLLAG